MKRFGNYLGKCLVTAALSTVLFAQAAMANTTATVIAESVKIRGGAGTSSEQIGSTEKGKTLSITGKTKDANGSTWYQIYVDEGITGYVRSDTVTVSSEGSIPDISAGTSSQASSATSATTDTATESANATSTDNTASEATTQKTTATNGTGVMIPDSSNIRNAAVTGDVLCTLQKGAVVTITGETNGSDSKKWYQVSFIKDSKNYTGYVRADLIDTSSVPVQESEDETPAADAGTATEGSSTSLKSLTISSGTISPEFSSDVTTYTIEADENTPEIAVSAVVTDPESQITSCEGFKDLQPGLNPAEIEVTAADGTSQKYHFTIICGEVTAEADTTEAVEEEENPYADMESMVSADEYQKYKDLAQKRLIILCVLGFLLAVSFVVIINLLLKISDLKDEILEGADEEEEELPRKRKTSKEKPKKQEKPRHSRHEYVKLDANNNKITDEGEESLRQKNKKEAVKTEPKAEVTPEQRYQQDLGFEEDEFDDLDLTFINMNTDPKH
ncbi:MAG: hypothetical protein E7294_01430 [Lachnospiraceae bacterium]|jgi:hypothetical protein|nr:hypothetical protein [Lachnospiraceae bacterium]